MTDEPKDGTTNLLDWPDEIGLVLQSSRDYLVQHAGGYETYLAERRVYYRDKDDGSAESAMMAYVGLVTGGTALSLYQHAELIACCERIGAFTSPDAFPVPPDVTMPYIAVAIVRKLLTDMEPGQWTAVTRLELVAIGRALQARGLDFELAGRDQADWAAQIRAAGIVAGNLEVRDSNGEDVYPPH